MGRLKISEDMHRAQKWLQDVLDSSSIQSALTLRQCIWLLIGFWSCDRVLMQVDSRWNRGDVYPKLANLISHKLTIDDREDLQLKPEMILMARHIAESMKKDFHLLDELLTDQESNATSIR